MNTETGKADDGRSSQAAGSVMEVVDAALSVAEFLKDPALDKMPKSAVYVLRPFVKGEGDGVIAEKALAVLADEVRRLRAAVAFRDAEHERASEQIVELQRKIMNSETGISPRAADPLDHEKVLAHLSADSWMVVRRVGNEWEYPEWVDGRIKLRTMPANCVSRWWPLPGSALRFGQSQNDKMSGRAQDKETK